jgi:hypothetical protein
MLRVRDGQGRVLFHLDGDNAVPRDSAGKVLGARAGKDSELTSLTKLAARWVSSAAPTLLDLAPSDVVQPSTQADYGIPDSSADCIADQVSPVKYVKNDRGYYFLESVGDAVRLVLGQVNLGGQQAEINPGFMATEFTTTGYALAARLPREVYGNADFDMKKRTLRFLSDSYRLARENRVATQLTTATSFAAANRIAAGAKWNGGTNPSPLTDLFAALKASYLPADTLVLPEIAAPFFFYGPGTGLQVRDYVQAGGQLPRILFARSKTLFGGAPAYTWMPLGTGAVPLVRTTQNLDAAIGTAATFRWLGEEGARGTRVDGVLVREFVDKSDSLAPTWLVLAVNDAEVVLSNQVGSIITGALA